MKIFTSLVFLFCCSVLLSSFTANKEMDEIISAIKSGNASQLSRYFDNRIDISLPGKSDNYSKTQGEMIMRDFFTNNQVRGLEIKHTGENKDGSRYCTGTLITRTGNYRTIFFVKQKGGKQLLQQLSFQTIE